MEKFKKIYTRTTQVISSVFYNALLVAVVLSLISFMGGIVKGQEGTVFGYKPIYVLTGSMEPTMRTKSLVIAKRVEAPEKLQEGDIVTYRIIDEEKQKEIKVTHRVTSVDTENKYINTKGDANEHVDFDNIPFGNVEYKVEYIHNWFADFINFASVPMNLIISAAVIVGVWLLAHLAHTSFYDPNYEFTLRNKKQEVIDVDLDDEK